MSNFAPLPYVEAELNYLAPMARAARRKVPMRGDLRSSVCVRIIIIPSRTAY